MSEKIEQLNKQVDNYYSLYQQAKDERDRIIDREQLPIIRKTLTGKCFKYRNAGGGEKWWLYVKVLSVKSMKSVLCLNAQEFLGRIEIVQDSNYSIAGNNDDYIPISKKEFDRHFNRLLKKSLKA